MHNSTLLNLPSRTIRNPGTIILEHLFAGDAKFTSANKLCTSQISQRPFSVHREKGISKFDFVRHIKLIPENKLHAYPADKFSSIFNALLHAARGGLTSDIRGATRVCSSFFFPLVSDPPSQNSPRSTPLTFGPYATSPYPRAFLLPCNFSVSPTTCPHVTYKYCARLKYHFAARLSVDELDAAHVHEIYPAGHEVIY